MLVDTTIWVDHLRRGDAVLVGLLQHLQVTVQPNVDATTDRRMTDISWGD